MGGGSWTTSDYKTYACAHHRSVDAASGELSGTYSTQDIFKSAYLHKELNPKNVIRECLDTEEHPETIPVILALDVTGSMGKAAVEVAKKLNVVMTNLYKKVKDVEFLIMGIGDFAYDDAPLQVSQFESDIRIAEQLDSLWFEGGGGGNNFESYTAAWYFGVNHTKLDCWKRGKKGIIITMGDEILNPYICGSKIKEHIGDELQVKNVETNMLYKEVIEKYDVYHLVVVHNTSTEIYKNELKNSFSEVIGEDNVKIVNVNNISDAIVDIIANNEYNSSKENNITNNVISW